MMDGMVHEIAGGLRYGIDVGNDVALFVLAFFWFDYLFTVTSNALNIKSLDPTIPKEFVDILDAKEYKSSQIYTKAKAAFKMVQDLWGVVEFHGLWYIGLYNAIDVYIRAHWTPVTGYVEVEYGCWFLVVTLLFSTITAEPFSLYHTFVLEERFGFNKTTLSTHIKDLIKGLGLGIALGTPIFGLVVHILGVMGPNAWLYCWGTVSAFMLVMQFLAPIIILPLFYKMTPLEEGELSNELSIYANKQNFQFSGVYVIDGSTRSSHSNAFFTGFGKSKRICIYDTLLENSTTDEIVAILGHEIGHYKKYHIWLTTGLGILQTGFTLYVLQQTLELDSVFAAFKIDTPSIYMGLTLFSGLFAPVNFVTGILMKMFSRRNEFEADEYSINTVGKPEALVSGLKGLTKNSQSNLTPHPLFVFVNYSHPPIVERIRHIEKYAKKGQ